tara:strand:+ start:68 stop:715 length:648 start_codon:yes stop_codon:yes gene_type:complete
MLRFILIIICLIFLSCDGSKSSFNQVNDCLGNSIPIDCSDTTIPGCAYINNCGICVGGGSTNNDILDCCPIGFSENFEDKCVPSEFLYPVISTAGAGYLFQLVQIELDGLNQSISSTDCIDVNDCDWVGAFNGDVCVGANQWNTEDCLGNICEVFVYGNDYQPLTPEEYMIAGEYPTFKIYDASENIYYNTLSLGNDYPWGYQVIHNIPLLLGQP